MSASSSDMFMKVGRATATTLSAPGYTVGNTTINVASTTNYPTDTGVFVAVDEVDSSGERISGSYNVFRGVVSSATQISSLVYQGGDANRNYSAGATTRVYIVVSSYQMNRLIDGLLVAHNQDGTLKDTAIPANSIDNSNIKTAAAIDGSKLADTSIPTAKYQDSSVSNAKLKTGAGEPGGAWDTWTPTLSGRFNNAKWDKACRYKRIGDTIFCRLSLVANTATPMDGGSGDATLTLPVPAKTEYTGHPLAAISLFGYGGTIRLAGSTADILAWNVGSTYPGLNGLSSSIPISWASGNVIFGVFVYEAA